MKRVRNAEPPKKPVSVNQYRIVHDLRGPVPVTKLYIGDKEIPDILQIDVADASPNELSRVMVEFMPGVVVHEEIRPTIIDKICQDAEQYGAYSHSFSNPDTVVVSIPGLRSLLERHLGGRDE